MRVLFILIYAFYSLSGYCQQASFSATVDKSRIVIGEPFQLLLKGTATSSAEWLKIDTFPFFEILETGKVDTAKTGAVYIWQQNITLTSWDSGRHSIPSFSFAGKRSKPILITVSFAPFNPAQDYHDIKEIIEVEKEPRTVWYWYVALGLFLLGLAALMFPAQKRQAPLEAAPDETIFKKSMQGLEALQKKGEEIDAKAFYTGLISILRTYLHKRKGISSYSKTTDDLVRQVPGFKLIKEEEVAFITTLQESDMVKFAQSQPTLSQREADLKTIKAAIIAIEES
jgi:hypothetical protein